MTSTFDFAPNSHVAEEIVPEEPSAVTMNGWDAVARPSIPYRARFKLTLAGMYWRGDPAKGDLTTNAERLQDFYRAHRMWGEFFYDHERYGQLRVRFAEPVNIPKALPTDQRENLLQAQALAWKIYSEKLTVAVAGCL